MAPRGRRLRSRRPRRHAVCLRAMSPARVLLSRSRATGYTAGVSRHVTAARHRSVPMSSPLHLPSRRLFLVSGAIAATSPFWTVRGAFAEELTRTPSQTEGPFYPNKLPLDTDNDLLVINDGITPAIGDVTHLTGKILDAKGNPVKNAVVEIWQCDANGVYLHTKDSEPKKDKQDKNFQGFGRFVTS